MVDKDFDLTRALNKMYGLECFLYDDRHHGIDIVYELKNSINENKKSFLEEIDLHIFSKYLEELSKKDIKEVYKKRFLIGGMNPEMFLENINFYSAVDKMIYSFTNSSDIALKLDISIKSSIMNDEYPELVEALNKHRDIKKNPIIGDRNFDKNINIELLRLFLKDLVILSEEISYSRLDFFSTYLHNLAILSEDKRLDFMQRMIERRYPFSDENKNEWVSYFETE